MGLLHCRGQAAPERGESPPRSVQCSARAHPLLTPGTARAALAPHGQTWHRIGRQLAGRSLSPVPGVRTGGRGVHVTGFLFPNLQPGSPGYPWRRLMEGAERGRSPAPRTVTHAGPGGAGSFCPPSSPHSLFPGIGPGYPGAWHSAWRPGSSEGCWREGH